LENRPSFWQFFSDEDSKFGFSSDFRSIFCRRLQHFGERRRKTDSSASDDSWALSRAVGKRIFSHQTAAGI
jgi:hypothetical protein